jgi:hypothetical protein
MGDDLLLPMWFLEAVFLVIVIFFTAVCVNETGAQVSNALQDRSERSSQPATRPVQTTHMSTASMHRIHTASLSTPNPTRIHAASLSTPNPTRIHAARLTITLVGVFVVGVNVPQIPGQRYENVRLDGVRKDLERVKTFLKSLAVAGCSVIFHCITDLEHDHAEQRNMQTFYKTATVDSFKSVFRPGNTKTREPGLLWLHVSGHCAQGFIQGRIQMLDPTGKSFFGMDASVIPQMVEQFDKNNNPIGIVVVIDTCLGFPCVPVDIQIHVAKTLDKKIVTRKQTGQDKSSGSHHPPKIAFLAAATRGEFAVEDKEKGGQFTGFIYNANGGSSLASDIVTNFNGNKNAYQVVHLVERHLSRSNVGLRNGVYFGCNNDPKNPMNIPFTLKRFMS